MRRPFTHSVLVRPTAFQSRMPAPSNKRHEFHSLYSELIRDDARNRRICEDVIEAVEAGRSCSRKETNISTVSPINWREELATSSCSEAAWERNSAKPWPPRSPRFPQEKDGSFSRLAVTSAKDSMMRGWTRCF